MLKTNTATTVHQRLRDEHGLAVGLTSFRRYVWREFPEENLRNIATPPRPDVPPGEEAQIDYGYLGTWLDPLTERMRRVWAFVLVLACSRYMFVRPVLTMDQRTWTAVPRRGLCLFWWRAASPCERQPQDRGDQGRHLRPAAQPLLRRVGRPLRLPHRPGSGPETEGQAEGRANDALRQRFPVAWTRLGRPAPTCKPVRSLGAPMSPVRVRTAPSTAPRRSRCSTSTESPALIALPSAPFELATWSYPKVGPDCYARSGKALYTVPWRFIGCQVDARAGERTVEFYVDGKVIKTWARVEKGKQTDWADFPPEKVAFFMRTPQWCLKHAGELGANVKALVEGLLEVNALYRLRQAQGVVRLADKHGAERLDAACRRAIEIGDPEYRTVKGILIAGTEEEGTHRTRRP